MNIHMQIEICTHYGLSVSVCVCMCRWLSVCVCVCVRVEMPSILTLFAVVGVAQSHLPGGLSIDLFACFLIHFLHKSIKMRGEQKKKTEMIYNCQIDGPLKQEIKYSNQCSGN